MMGRRCPNDDKLLHADMAYALFGTQPPTTRAGISRTHIEDKTRARHFCFCLRAIMTSFDVEKYCATCQTEDPHYLSTWSEDHSRMFAECYVCNGVFCPSCVMVVRRGLTIQSRPNARLHKPPGEWLRFPRRPGGGLYFTCVNINTPAEEPAPVEPPPVEPAPIEPVPVDWSREEVD